MDNIVDVPEQKWPPKGLQEILLDVSGKEIYERQWSKKKVNNEVETIRLCIYMTGRAEKEDM